jgi:hypothetical protein
MKAILCLLAMASPAMAGPDFVTAERRPGQLAASGGVREIAPMDDVLFGVDSEALSDAASVQLRAAAAWWAKHPRMRLVLEGYTDASGPRFYNEELATRRAANARRRLIGLGVPSDRIVVVVYGENGARSQDDPLARRVVIYATDRSAEAIASASLDGQRSNGARAQGAIWVERNVLFKEARATEPRAQRTIIGSR